MFIMPAPAPSVDWGGWALLCTNVFGFLSLLMTTFFKLWQDSRQRRWDLEDRRRIDDESKARDLATATHRTQELARLAEVKDTAATTAEGVKKTQEIIEVLEKNTNSIKDALVKTTGDAAYAQGLKDGVEKKDA